MPSRTHRHALSESISSTVFWDRGRLVSAVSQTLIEDNEEELRKLFPLVREFLSPGERLLDFFTNNGLVKRSAAWDAWDCLEAMLEGVSEDERRAVLTRAAVLVTSILSGRQRVTQELLDIGIDVRQPAADTGSCPLHAAVQVDDLALAEQLLLRAPDVAAKRDAVGRSPLEIAVARGNEAMAELLRGFMVPRKPSPKAESNQGHFFSRGRSFLKKKKKRSENEDDNVDRSPGKLKVEGICHGVDAQLLPQ